MRWSFRRHSGESTSEEGEEDYWISYADLMAGLLLAFIVILTAVQLQSSRKLQEKRKKVEQQQRELEQMESKVQNLLGVRAALMKRLKGEFADSSAEIRFDDATGSIRLGSRILFDEGSAELTRRGKRKLRDLMPLYFDALLGDPQLREHVGQIIFQGHTNSNYSGPGGELQAYLFNLELSQDRAFNAMRFVLERELGSKYGVRDLLQASGFSYSRPIYREESGGERIEDKAASRRIEIRFRLKGEKTLRRLRKMFEGRLPNSRAGEER